MRTTSQVLTDVEIPIDLSPAAWIWTDAQRTLPNTVVLFRHDFDLRGDAVDARGHITADSRYRLWVNGHRVQTGPAPCDPRVWEADPIRLDRFLRPGRNSIAVEVLYLGAGEGTYTLGKPGMIFSLAVREENGDELTIVSDEHWRCRVDRSRPPGRHRRWFLRGWQELVDLRLEEADWMTGDGEGAAWRGATRLPVAADTPPIASPLSDAIFDVASPFPERTWIVERTIAPLNESTFMPARRVDSGVVDWGASSLDDWFDFRMGDPVVSAVPATELDDRGEGLRIPAARSGRSAIATYRLDRQIVGWPRIVFSAPAGTVIDVVTQESHDPEATAWLDTHFYTSSRVIAPGGEAVFEPFEFDSFAWIQLVVSDNDEEVTVKDVSVRRRLGATRSLPAPSFGDQVFERVIRANLHTLENSAQDAVVDGMGRERQQYSGDGSHQLTEIRRFFGDASLPTRFLRTFGRGACIDGYFMDSWPGVDRLQRIVQRELSLTGWGPILDHSVGFIADCWRHYWETGDAGEAVAQFPRLLRFVEYLARLRGTDGLLPVEDIGIPSVWMDHDAFRTQRDKQCAFNLYVIGVLRSAFLPLADLAGSPSAAKLAERLGTELHLAVSDRFWSTEASAFVSNLPWSDGDPVFDDRSLSMSILYGLCPGGDVAESARLLVEMPPQVGRSYPANAVWRSRALLQTGHRIEAIDDIRTAFSSLASVTSNATLQESWHARADSTDEWSHCAVAPLVVLAEGVLGLEALSPGYERLLVRPCTHGLGEVDVTVHVPWGEVRLQRTAEHDAGCVVTLPPGYVVIEQTPDGLAAQRDGTASHPDPVRVVLR